MARYSSASRSHKAVRSPCKTVARIKDTRIMQLIRQTKTRLYEFSSYSYHQKKWVERHGVTTPCTACRDPKACKSQVTRIACLPCKKAQKSPSCSRHTDAIVHTILWDHAEYSEEKIRRAIQLMEQQGNRPPVTPRPKQATPPRRAPQPPAKPENTTDDMDIDTETFSPSDIPTTPIRSTTRAPSRQRATPPPSQASRNIHIGDPDRDGWTKEDYEKAYLRATDLLISQENINVELGEQKRRFYADWKDMQEANEIRITTLENNKSALVDEIEVLKKTNQDLRDEIKSLKQTMAEKEAQAQNEKLHYMENTLNELKKYLETHTRRVNDDHHQTAAFVVDEDEIVSPAVMLWRNKYDNEVALKRERRHRLFNDLRQIDLLYGQLQKSIQKRKVTAGELKCTIQGHLEELSRWVMVLNRAEGFR